MIKAIGILSGIFGEAARRPRSNESRRSGRTGARANYSEQIAEYEERGERIPAGLRVQPAVRASAVSSAAEISSGCSICG